MEWQVYSGLRKSVIARIQTHGEANIVNTVTGGAEQLLVSAFRENVRSLIASPDFRKSLSSGPTQVGEVVGPTSFPAIRLAGAGDAAPRSLNEAIASVVLVSAGRSQGSGFLASTDGFILTDRHVVGDAQAVIIRWSDGVETPGEVVRSDKVRDVALIKTDPRGRLPLKLGRDPLQPGDTVFAIGTPLNAKFQSTVTRGIVSAYRTFEGLKFVQSDVSVNPGSSGGPLLDEKGVVIALTEIGYRVGGAPTEINLFTPVEEALRFLGLETGPPLQAHATLVENMARTPPAKATAARPPSPVSVNMTAPAKPVDSGSPRSTAQERSSTTPSYVENNVRSQSQMSNEAFLIGEAHAIRKICSNDTDQYWLDRLSNMVAKAPEPYSAKALTARFYDGYNAAEAHFAVCENRALVEEGRLRKLLSAAD
jgi:S1-C subfamily serine protease/predicted secreted protein